MDVSRGLFGWIGNALSMLVLVSFGVSSVAWADDSDMLNYGPALSRSLTPPTGSAVYDFASASSAIDGYTFQGSVQLPVGTGAFDTLPAGEMVTLSGDQLYVESAPGSGLFDFRGQLPDADISFPAFVKVSPDGGRIAVGNNGGASFSDYQLGVFDVNTLAGSWSDVSHFDATWYDNQFLAVSTSGITQPSGVVMVDTLAADPASSLSVLVDSIGGASAGLAFDDQGNLYTGNGFTFAGPSVTGAIKAFDQNAWSTAVSTGTPLDFEQSGTLIAEVLSAGSLGFDSLGNLHVGGGDFSSGDLNYAALIDQDAILQSLAGSGLVDLNDPGSVRRFDPDAANQSNFYDVTFATGTNELLIREGSTAYRYVVPEPASVALLLTGLAAGWFSAEARKRRRKA